MSLNGQLAMYMRYFGLAFLAASVLMGCAHHQLSAVIHVEMTETTTAEDVASKIENYLESEGFKNEGADVSRWWLLSSESSIEYAKATSVSTHEGNNLVIWMTNFTDLSLYRSWNSESSPYYRDTDTPLVKIQFSERRRCEQCGFSDRATAIYRDLLRKLTMLFASQVIIVAEPQPQPQPQPQPEN